MVRVKGESEGNYQRIRVFVVWSCTAKVVSVVIGAGQMG